MIIKMYLFILVSILISGCVSPIRDKGISGTMSDTQINSVIGTRLHAKSSKAFAQIDVDVHMGEVLLTGFIDDIDIGIEAEKIAWKTDGVKAVYNHIQNCVESSLLDYTKDAWITTKIKSQFATSKHIKSFNYSLKTIAATVYILGVSQNDQELKEVHDLAQKTKGVMKVVSYAKLKKNLY
jgi:osmotically-inducible protein OsmY